MASTITIPVDVHLITLYLSETRIVTRDIRVGRETQQRRVRVTEERDISPEVTDGDVRVAFQQANQILQPMDIRFTVRSCRAQRAAAPAGQERVDDSGFFTLARDYPPNNGISMLVVRNFHDRDLGGSAVEAQRICIIKKLDNPTFGHVLAHEFGHLLDLPHMDARDDTAVDNYNLMYPGLRAGHRLTQEQVARARRSSLATQVGAIATGAAR